MNLHITLEHHSSLTFVAQTVRIEKRSPLAFLSSEVLHGELFVTQCSWCKKIAGPEGQWLEVEDALPLMPEFRDARPPKITHGICSACNLLFK